MLRNCRLVAGAVHHPSGRRKGRLTETAGSRPLLSGAAARAAPPDRESVPIVFLKVGKHLFHPLPSHCLQRSPFLHGSPMQLADTSHRKVAVQLLHRPCGKQIARVMHEAVSVVGRIGA